MQIRLMATGTKDYEQMLALRLRVLLRPIGIPPSYINPEKEKHDLLIGAYEKDVLIGCCILTPVDESTLQLRQMAVENSLQKQGVGTALVAFAEDVAKEKGCQKINDARQR